MSNLKFVTIWGTGLPLREFLHVEDMARASIKIMNLDKKKYNKIVKPMSHINIGSGQEISIKDLAIKIKKIVDYRGKVKYDFKRPDGTLRKITDIKRLVEIEFKHKIDLEKGLKRTYMDFLARDLSQN